MVNIYNNYEIFAEAKLDFFAHTYMGFYKNFTIIIFINYNKHIL